jgi:hypothetical protein
MTKWKKLVIYGLWLAEMFLVMFPELFEEFTFIKEHGFALTLTIGSTAAILLLSDLKKMKKQALENMAKYLEEDKEKSKRKNKQA